MKKMIITLILSLIFIPCIAPKSPTFLPIMGSKPDIIYNLSDPLARGVAYYESRFNIDAVNEVSGARGLMQITEPMIKEVNMILKKIGWNWPPYTFADAFDPKKSIDIWYIVQNYKNPEYYPDRACRIWFGTGVQYDGKRWEDYYNEVIIFYK